MTSSLNGTLSTSDLPPSNGGKPPDKDGDKNSDPHTHTPPMDIITIDDDHGDNGDKCQDVTMTTTTNTKFNSVKQQEQQGSQNNLSIINQLQAKEDQNKNDIHLKTTTH